MSTCLTVCTTSVWGKLFQNIHHLFKKIKPHLTGQFLIHNPKWVLFLLYEFWCLKDAGELVWCHPIHCNMFIIFRSLKEKIRQELYGKWCCSKKLQTCCSQQTPVFWNVLLWSLVEIYWHLAQTCCLHLLFHDGSSKFLHSVIDIYYTT